METINIQKENVVKAYNSSNDEQKKLLEALFGKETFKPKDITERIKTFEDACKELGTNHPLVLQYEFNYNAEGGWNDNADTRDLSAYLKLRIITAALNEGWEPQFTKGERRWYVWYNIITKNEYNKLTDEEKSRAVLRSHNGASASGGLVYADAGYDSSFSNSLCGSRLAFKAPELAKYAGVQFIELYADFCLRADGKAE